MTTLNEFLSLLDPGGLPCFSVLRLPYDQEQHRYTKTYCEEMSTSALWDIESFDPEGLQDLDTPLSKILQQVGEDKVNNFTVIGGGMDKVELRIFLAPEPPEAYRKLLAQSDGN